MAKYFPIQVSYSTPEEREDAIRFLKTKYGRSFSNHIINLIRKDMAKEKANAKPD